MGVWIACFCPFGIHIEQGAGAKKKGGPKPSLSRSSVKLNLLSSVGRRAAGVAAQRGFEGARSAGVAHLGGDAAAGRFDRDQQVAAQEGAEALEDDRVRQDQVAVDRQGEGAGGAGGIVERGRLAVEVEHAVGDRDANRGGAGAGVRQAHLRLRLRLRTREPGRDEVRAVQSDRAGVGAAHRTGGIAGDQGRRQAGDVRTSRDGQLVSRSARLRQGEVRVAADQGVHLGVVHDEAGRGGRLGQRAAGRDGGRQAGREVAGDDQGAAVDNVSGGDAGARQAAVVGAAGGAGERGGDLEVAAQFSREIAVAQRSDRSGDAGAGELLEVRQGGLGVVRGGAQRRQQDVLVADQGAGGGGVDRRGDAAGGDGRRRGDGDIGFGGRVGGARGQGEAVDSGRAAAGRGVHRDDEGDRRSRTSALNDRRGASGGAAGDRLVDGQGGGFTGRDGAAGDVEGDLEGLGRRAGGDRRLGGQGVGDDEGAGGGLIRSVGALLGDRVEFIGRDRLTVDRAGDGAGLGDAGESHGRDGRGGEKSSFSHLDMVPQRKPVDVDEPTCERLSATVHAKFGMAASTASGL